MLFDHFIREIDGVFDELADITPIQHRLNDSRFDTAHVQQIIDDPVQTP